MTSTMPNAHDQSRDSGPDRGPARGAHCRDGRQKDPGLGPSGDQDVEEPYHKATRLYGAEHSGSAPEQQAEAHYRPRAEQEQHPHPADEPAGDDGIALAQAGVDEERAHQDLEQASGQTLAR